MADRCPVLRELRAAAESYLAMRRTLGFKLTTQGRTLMRFVAYCEAHHADHITADLALAWAIDTPRSSDEVYWSRRLMVVRILVVAAEFPGDGETRGPLTAELVVSACATPDPPGEPGF